MATKLDAAAIVAALDCMTLAEAQAAHETLGLLRTYADECARRIAYTAAGWKPETDAASVRIHEILHSIARS